MGAESSALRALSSRVWRSERDESEMGGTSEEVVELRKWRISSSSVTIRAMASSMTACSPLIKRLAVRLKASPGVCFFENLFFPLKLRFFFFFGES